MTLKAHLIQAPLSLAGNPIAKNRAELLAVLLLSRGLVFLCILFYIHWMNLQPALPGVLISVGFNFVAYFLARTKYYQCGAGLIIVEGLISIPLILHHLHGAESTVGPLWLGLGTLISSLVLPVRYTVLSIVATAVATVYMGVQLDRAMMPFFGSVVLFTTTSSILTLIGTYLRDKTDHLLELERAKVLQISKLSALGEMAGSIAHEMNTPLGAMILNAEMIETRNLELPEPDNEISLRAQSIVDVGFRISKIIAGLKGFSRDAKDDEQRTFSVRDLVVSTTDLCREKFKSNGVALEVAEEHLETLIQGQIIQLSQTLLNLLNNSFDAIHSFEKKWVRISVALHGPQLEIRVTDCGSGISPKLVEKIFQPFFTTKAPGRGTGLGLSISKNIIKNHGGQLLYDDHSVHTCFIIKLPVIY